MASELGHILMFGTLDMEGHGDLHEVSRQAAHDVLQARKRQMQERITQPDWRARKQELELAQPAKLAKLVEMGEPGKHEQQFVNEQLEMPEPFKRDPFVNVKAETAEPFKQEQLVNAKLETAEPVKQEQLANVKTETAEPAKQEQLANVKTATTEPAKQEQHVKTETAEPVKQEQLANVKIETAEPAKQEQLANVKTATTEPAKQEQHVKTETAEPVKQEQLANVKTETAEPVKQEQVRRQWKAGDLRMNGPAGNLEIAEHAYVEGCCWSQSFCQNNCNTRRLINKRNYTLPQEVIILSK